MGDVNAALEQVKSAILHELRTSGPLGLGFGELLERLGLARTALSDAIRALFDDGRVRLARERPGPLLVLTACQRELDESDAERFGTQAESVSMRRERDEARSEVCNAWDEADRRLNQWANTQRSLDEARAEISRLESALNEATVTAEEEADRLRAAVAEYRDEIRLSARAMASLDVAADIRRLAFSASGQEPSAYATGLLDAAFIAGGGGRGTKVLSARIVFQEGTTASVLVLRDNGPQSDPDNARIVLLNSRFVLGSARFGRMHAREDGTIPGSPIRIHPDDLAVLKGES